MKKTSFLTLDKAKEIASQIPTPFHIYDEAGIRANARALKAAFAWNPGYKEYFAVKKVLYFFSRLAGGGLYGHAAEEGSACRDPWRADGRWHHAGPDPCGHQSVFRRYQLKNTFSGLFS